MFSSEFKMPLEVICAGSIFQLAQYPQSVLAGRYRIIRRRRRFADSNISGCGLLLYQPGMSSNSNMIKKLFYRYLYLKCAVVLIYQLNNVQAVTTQFKENIFSSDKRQPEYLLPYGCNFHFQGSDR